jgi:hypothetical protein
MFCLCNNDPCHVTKKVQTKVALYLEESSSVRYKLDTTLYYIYTIEEIIVKTRCLYGNKGTFNTCIDHKASTT